MCVNATQTSCNVLSYFLECVFNTIRMLIGQSFRDDNIRNDYRFNIALKLFVNKNNANIGRRSCIWWPT